MHGLTWRELETGQRSGQDHGDEGHQGKPCGQRRLRDLPPMLVTAPAPDPTADLCLQPLRRRYPLRHGRGFLPMRLAGLRGNLRPNSFTPPEGHDRENPSPPAFQTVATNAIVVGHGIRFYSPFGRCSACLGHGLGSNGRGGAGVAPLRCPGHGHTSTCRQGGGGAASPRHPVRPAEEKQAH